MKVGGVGEAGVDPANPAGNPANVPGPSHAQRPSAALTVSAFAAAMFVAPRTVRGWIASGIVSAHQTPGGHHRIPRTELERLRPPMPQRAAA